MLPSTTDKYMDPIKRYFSGKHWKKPFALIYYSFFFCFHSLHSSSFIYFPVLFSLPSSLVSVSSTKKKRKKRREEKTQHRTKHVNFVCETCEFYFYFSIITSWWFYRDEFFVFSSNASIVCIILNELWPKCWTFQRSIKVLNLCKLAHVFCLYSFFCLLPKTFW